MNHYYFIHQNSRKEKLKTLFIALSLLVGVIVIASIFSSLWYPIFQASISGGVFNSINHASLSGVFYTHLIGGIFFVPSPDELVYFYGLTRGINMYAALALALTGYMLAQVVNYLLGIKLSNFMLNFISKKKIYSVRRSINKYGIYGIIFFNITPAPAPLLTFALGLAKYNRKKLFVVTFLSKLAEYAIITLFFFLISG